MLDLGVQPHIIETIINHVSGHNGWTLVAVLLDR
jgi:hypothetical protein